MHKVAFYVQSKDSYNFGNPYMVKSCIESSISIVIRTTWYRQTPWKVVRLIYLLLGVLLRRS